MNVWTEMTLTPDASPSIIVELSEWDVQSYRDNGHLRGISLKNDVAAQRVAESLKSQIEIREGYDGLEIETTSFVGRVDVGPVRLLITPKLPAMPLTRLLRYAYGLRDLSIRDETEAPTTRHGLHELLIAMLAAEIDQLLRRGLSRQYVPRAAKLESPRGSILIEQLISNGGLTSARLPCRFFQRESDWHLNRVLLGGALMAASMTDDHELRRRLHRCAVRFGDVTPRPLLSAKDVEVAKERLTRLTATSAPALTIIGLLLNMKGIALDTRKAATRIPGFLFDMNTFFQALLSRFLRENLPSYRIEDEFVLRHIFAYASDANPKRRSPPKPRPDFALFAEDKLITFLDAKYRDIWERGYPAEWLYQASIYALASPARLCTLLYASMSEVALDEKVNLERPIGDINDLPGAVIMRPVSLNEMANLLDPSAKGSAVQQRSEWAAKLVRSYVNEAI